MKIFELIGEAWRASHPYDVRIHWDDKSQAKIPHPIALGEGSGHAAMGGLFTLSDMLEEKWADHLQICGCLWLRDLAHEEKLLGRFFSANEIYARWQTRAYDK